MVDDVQNQSSQDAALYAALVLLYAGKDERSRRIARASVAAGEGRGSPDLQRALADLASAASAVPGLTEPIQPDVVKAAEEAVLQAWEAQLS
jgi:hypothetical protein